MSESVQIRAWGIRETDGKTWLCEGAYTREVSDRLLWYPLECMADIKMRAIYRATGIEAGYIEVAEFTPENCK